MFYFFKNSALLAFSIHTRNDNLYFKLVKQTSKVLLSILSISLDGKQKCYKIFFYIMIFKFLLNQIKNENNYINLCKVKGHEQRCQTPSVQSRCILYRRTKSLYKDVTRTLIRGCIFIYSCFASSVLLKCYFIIQHAQRGSHDISNRL